MHRKALLLGLAGILAVSGFVAFAPTGATASVSAAGDFQRHLVAAQERLLTPPPEMVGEESAVLWNPASVSISSGCWGSICIASGCVGSGCFGSGCVSSGCSGSACGVSGCVGSGCLASGCVGSICVGSTCVGSVCAGTTCAGSACSATRACAVEPELIEANVVEGTVASAWWETMTPVAGD